MARPNEEKILTAARKVFVRYGFRRVTMGDLAEAAKMSRPALYLVFPSKEEVFTAVLKRVFAEVLDEIRQGIPLRETPLEKLTFAFEVWCVRPFEMVQASPDAGDLFESSLEFAAEFTIAATTEFEITIAQILEPLVGGKPEPEFSAAQIRAHDGLCGTWFQICGERFNTYQYLN